MAVVASTTCACAAARHAIIARLRRWTSMRHLAAVPSRRWYAACESAPAKGHGFSWLQSLIVFLVHAVYLEQGARAKDLMIS